MQGRLIGAFLALTAPGSAASAAPEPPVPSIAAPDDASAESAARYIKLGALTFGVSLPEIRDALPSAKWAQTQVSPYSGRVFEISAKNAFDYAGFAFNVVAHEHYYVRELQLDTQLTAASAEECAAAALRVMSAVESDIGALQSLAPMTIPARSAPLQWGVTRMPGGGAVVTPQPGWTTPARMIGETITFGNGSTALFVAKRANGKTVKRKDLATKPAAWMTLSTHRAAGRVTIRIDADYDETREASCATYIAVTRRDPEPEPKSIAYDESRLVRTISIGARHRLATEVLALAPGGAEATFSCSVSRGFGTTGCSRADDSPIDVAVAQKLRQVAEAAVFNVEGFDRDDPQPLRTRIVARLSAADLRPIDFAAAARTPLSEIPWIERARPADLERFYPAKAMREAVGARVVVTCQLQTDGSSVCANGSTDAAEFAPDFIDAAKKTLERFRASPKLTDGRPSAGAVFDMPIVFQIAE